MTHLDGMKPQSRCKGTYAHVRLSKRIEYPCGDTVAHGQSDRTCVSMW